MNANPDLGCQKTECPTCLGMHDEAIHEATETIHLWLRDRIAYQTQPFKLIEM